MGIIPNSPTPEVFRASDVWYLFRYANLFYTRCLGAALVTLLFKPGIMTQIFLFLITFVKCSELEASPSGTFNFHFENSLFQNRDG